MTVFAIAELCDFGDKRGRCVRYACVEKDDQLYMRCYLNLSVASRDAIDNRYRDSFVEPLEADDVCRILGEKERRLNGFALVYSDGSCACWEYVEKKTNE
jgi:hypothetical protein